MPNTMQPKRYVELNCATIKNLRQFVEQIMVPYMQNEDATFLFDECHMLPKDVTMALLTITNPNKHNSNTFSYEGADIEIDFKTSCCLHKFVVLRTCLCSYDLWLSLEHVVFQNLWLSLGPVDVSKP